MSQIWSNNNKIYENSLKNCEIVAKKKKILYSIALWKTCLSRIRAC